MTEELDKPNKLLHWYHWLVLSASLLLTLIAWKVSDNQIQEKRLELFKVETKQLLDQISERMSYYEVALKAGAATIKNIPENELITDWKTFSEQLNLTETYPGINGIGVIYYLPQSKVEHFIAQQRIDRAHFNIHPQHTKQEYWPITHIEPLQDNDKAVGLDITFEEHRLAAAIKARDTATTQITAPIVLVQDTEKSPGFLQFIPFYNATDLTTQEQRKKHFVGHIYAPFIMNKLMEATLKQKNRHIVFSLFDGNQSFYNELTTDNNNYDGNPLFQKKITMEMYGRPWTFNMQTALSFKKATHSSQPLIILGSGIIINSLLLLVFITLIRSQQKANSIAKTLAISEKHYKHIIESAPCGMIITNKQGEIEKINPQTELLFGYKSHELINQKIDMLIPKRFQQQHPKLREGFNKNPSNRQMGLNREVFGLTKKGEEFPAEIGLAQFKEGDNFKILATVIDISEHVQITDELKRSNKELHDFAYVASHDLKAPLRGIMQLASWIEEDTADFATQDTKNNLALLMNRTSRLEKLLEDLLTYARISRNLGDIQTVNINELVLSIFDLQSPPQGISITYQGSLEDISTDLLPLEIILRNLISNAIKHRDSDQLCINITAQEYPTYYQFSVEDDGLGIPEKHHEKIFDLFKTLRPRDEVEGSGMGLSIIKKLLDYKKCAIKVTSDGESGSCFTFTWPK
ncbi:CHASE domain-containing protein [Colwellia asteriadis]|uniref:histidine kinase n=1 Tax=Colwellia asteriadis TaxID=517723 RepID=A0ABP3WCS3_9GAMM